MSSPSSSDVITPGVMGEGLVLLGGGPAGRVGEAGEAGSLVAVQHLQDVVWTTAAHNDNNSSSVMHRPLGGAVGKTPLVCGYHAVKRRTVESTLSTF